MNELHEDPPQEIVKAAILVGDWFKKENITDWVLMDCCSRSMHEKARKMNVEQPELILSKSSLYIAIAALLLAVTSLILTLRNFL